MDDTQNINTNFPGEFPSKGETFLFTSESVGEGHPGTTDHFNTLFKFYCF